MSNSLVNADQNEVIIFDRGGNGLICSTDLISTTSRVYHHFFEVLPLISVEMHWRILKEMMHMERSKKVREI
jgi:hypothetical protein